jgi:hypothetical protein
MMRIDRRLVWIAAAAVILSGGLISCAGMQKKDAAAGGREKAPKYYDFEDVLVPRELEQDPKSSFIYHTAGLTAGVLVYTSKVELNSLVEFFQNNMANDNWQSVGVFKSPRTLLLFKKQNRWCVINITDESYKTLVEIWVAPMNAPVTGRLLH